VKSNTFKILSISGGGARGIFQAVFLKKLEERIEKPLCEEFDLIAGTSTGAIIALALSLGISSDKIVSLYQDHSSNIFKPRFLRKGYLSGLRKGPLYDQSILREQLKKVFKTKQLRDAKTNIIVTASCLDQFSHRVFASFNNHSPADSDLLAVEAALASSAAPTYFPPVKPSNSENSFIDGGIWANSPSLIALLWGNCYLGTPLESMRLLSIGNGDFPRGVLSQHFTNFRKYSSKTIQTLFEIMFSAQESAADKHAQFLIGNENLIRISTQLSEFIALDDSDNAVKKLPALAEIQANEMMSQVLSMLEKNSSRTSCLKHKLICISPELIPEHLIEATGLAAFYPGRKFYNHRKDASSIDLYINTALKSIVMISINLMTGMPFAGICDVLKNKLESNKSFMVTISLLNPNKANLIFSISPSLDRTEKQLFSSIKDTIDQLVDFRATLSENAQKRFDIRIHNSIPFGSAIILDPHEKTGRIQIETKPYKAKLDDSFAFEIIPSDVNNFYENLVSGYEKLMQDGSSVEQVDFPETKYN